MLVDPHVVPNAEQLRQLIASPAQVGRNTRPVAILSGNGADVVLLS
jgi:hypothetical protein